MSRTTIPLYWIEHMRQQVPYMFTRTRGYDREDDTPYYRYTIYRQEDEQEICVINYEPTEYKDHNIMSIDRVSIQQGTHEFDVCKSIISEMNNRFKAEEAAFINFRNMFKYDLTRIHDGYDMYLNGKHIYAIADIPVQREEHGQIIYETPQQRYFNLVNPSCRVLPLNVPISPRDWDYLINRQK